MKAALIKPGKGFIQHGHACHLALNIRHLTSYAASLLDVLGIKYGPSHIEVKFHNNKIYLIEIGTRLAGRVDFSVIDRIMGANQLDLTVAAYIDKESFNHIYNTSQDSSKYLARYIYMKSKAEGKSLRKFDCNLLKHIKTLAVIHIVIKDYLYKTDKTNKKHRPGFAYLIAEDYKTLIRDYTRFIDSEPKLYQQTIERELIDA